MGSERDDLGRCGLELVLDDGEALGDRRADHRRTGPCRRLPPDAAEIRRPVTVRVRHDAVVRHSRHR
jgi:hypothetical protein